MFSVCKVWLIPSLHIAGQSSDWCEIYSLMQQSDWCEIHTLMEWSDWCEQHAKIDLRSFFLKKKPKNVIYYTNAEKKLWLPKISTTDVHCI